MRCALHYRFKPCSSSSSSSWLVLRRMTAVPCFAPVFRPSHVISLATAATIVRQNEKADSAGATTAAVEPVRYPCLPSNVGPSGYGSPTVDRRVDFWVALFVAAIDDTAHYSPPTPHVIHFLSHCEQYDTIAGGDYYCRKTWTATQFMSSVAMACRTEMAGFKSQLGHGLTTPKRDLCSDGLIRQYDEFWL